MKKEFFKLSPVSAFALFLVLFGIAKTYAPLLSDRDAIVALTQSTVQLNGKQAVAKVREKTGKPTLVYLYASWCDVCRYTSPILASYIRNKRFEDFRLVFIAFEHDAYTLATHLKRKEYDGLWVPYFVKGNPPPELQELSPDLVPGVPQFLAFDADGKLHTIKQGRLQPETLDAIIDALKPSARRTP